MFHTDITRKKIRSHLCTDSDRKDIFGWFIRSMISCGHSARISSFLEENGIKKEEIESASVQPDGNLLLILFSSKVNFMLFIFILHNLSVCRILLTAFTRSNDGRRFFGYWREEKAS